MKKNLVIKELATDYIICFVAGVITAFGIHYFSQYNNFAPGGISGVATIISWFTPQINVGYYIFLLNLPLFVLLSIFVEAKLGFNIAFYILIESLSLVFFEKLHVPYFKATEGTMIFACIGAGVVTGVGYGLQIRRNVSSGGTYSISTLIKRWYPAANVPWISFVMDCSVVLLVFFFGNGDMIITISTIGNLFIANVVVDYCLQGSKAGYKFEIITDNPEEIAQEIMTTLKHGVTELTVQGMYTHTQKYMIVCIIRKRELSKMMRILKKYKETFASFSKVSEVLGKFQK